MNDTAAINDHAASSRGRGPGQACDPGPLGRGQALLPWDRELFSPNSPQLRPSVWWKKKRSPYWLVLNVPRATPR
jgi:hypothetical protein